MIGILRNRNPTFDKVTDHYVYQHDKHMNDEDDDEPKIQQYLYEGKGKGNGSFSFLFQRIDPTSTMDVTIMFVKNYYKKAILSPSLDTAVVIHRLDPEGELAFARVGLQSTSPLSSWTSLPRSSKSSSTATSFLDIIFHQDRLHALDNWGALTIFDLDNPSSPPLFQSPAGNPMKGDHDCEMGYLVESPDGHDLFVVFRGIEDEDDNYDNGGKDATPSRTETFRVFKLDESSSDYLSKWERLKALETLPSSWGLTVLRLSLPLISLLALSNPTPYTLPTLGTQVTLTMRLVTLEFLVWKMEASSSIQSMTGTTNSMIRNLYGSCLLP